MSELRKQIGLRIRELRTQAPRKWTQEELSQRAEISVSFLSMIERGERMPHVETLSVLARALGVKMADLLGGEGVVPSQAADEAIAPLAQFARSRNLGPQEIARLVEVAHSMFASPQPS